MNQANYSKLLAEASERGRGKKKKGAMKSLLEERVVFLGDEVNDETANSIVVQLLYLESQDPNKDVRLYINSPGGSITAGLAIIDTMDLIECDVSTICLGQAASMGALMLACGAQGKRLALPHSRIMIHQPLSGVSGQQTDISIAARETERLRKVTDGLLAERSGQPLERICADTDRDNYMTAEQARDYGLIDKVLARQATARCE